MSAFHASERCVTKQERTAVVPSVRAAKRARAALRRRLGSSVLGAHAALQTRLRVSAVVSAILSMSTSAGTVRTTREKRGEKRDESEKPASSKRGHAATRARHVPRCCLGSRIGGSGAQCAHAKHAWVEDAGDRRRDGGCRDGDRHRMLDVRRRLSPSAAWNAGRARRRPEPVARRRAHHGDERRSAQRDGRRDSPQRRRRLHVAPHAAQVHVGARAGRDLVLAGSRGPRYEGACRRRHADRQPRVPARRPRRRRARAEHRVQGEAAVDRGEGGLGGPALEGRRSRRRRLRFHLGGAAGEAQGVLLRRPPFARRGLRSRLEADRSPDR